MPDTQMSRRGFLRGLFTVAGAAVVAPSILIPDELDPDRARWMRGEGRIWQVKGPTRPRTKAEIISELLRSSEGRKKLAASMTQPLRGYRSYRGVGRRVFTVEPLPDGALPLYDREPDVAAFVVGEEGPTAMGMGCTVDTIECDQTGNRIVTEVIDDPQAAFNAEFRARYAAMQDTGKMRLRGQMTPDIIDNFCQFEGKS